MGIKIPLNDNPAIRNEFTSDLATTAIVTYLPWSNLRSTIQTIPTNIGLDMYIIFQR